NGGSEAYLMIRKKDGSTNIALRVSKGQFVSSIRGGSVRLRFDKEPPITISTSESSDGSSDILFLNSESKIISKLKKSTSLIIEAEFFNEGNRIIEFTTKDFKWNH
ncbi:MAG TPA: hypothetical protein VGE24_17525, partial [Emticicia sp.]